LSETLSGEHHLTICSFYSVNTLTSDPPSILDGNMFTLYPRHSHQQQSVPRLQGGFITHLCHEWQARKWEVKIFV
jgi:hypothetical protein